MLQRSLFIIVAVLLTVGSPLAAQNPVDRLSVPVFVTALGTDSETWSIVMLDPTADGPERLTDDEYDDLQPIASPDGRYVVYLRGDFDDENAPFEYYLLDRDCLPGCEPRPLPTEANGINDLRWSPTEPKLVGWGPENATWVIDVETETVTAAAEGSWNAFPAWSPDGKQIVLTSDDVAPNATLSDDIMVIPADGGARVNLTYSGLYMEEYKPSFSPDGRFIAYLTRNIMPDEADPFHDSPFALITLDADCIDVPDTCLDSRSLLSVADHTVVEHIWSPDSRFVAYVAAPTFADTAGDIWVVDVRSGQAAQLTNEGTAGHLAWSPDSAAILFERTTDNSLDVYLALADGSREPGPILEGFAASGQPYWAARH